MTSPSEKKLCYVVGITSLLVLLVTVWFSQMMYARTSFDQQAHLHSFWTSVSGHTRCYDTQRVSIHNEKQLFVLLQKAAQQNVSVRVVGAGHSFPDIHCPSNRLSSKSQTQFKHSSDVKQHQPYQPYLINLDHYNKIRSVHRKTKTVIVESGIYMKDLLSSLHTQFNWTLASVPAVGDITLAGAIVTASHGSRISSGSMADLVLSVRLMLDNGTVMFLSPHSNNHISNISNVPPSPSNASSNFKSLSLRQLFYASLTNLGMSGILLTVQLQCIDSFMVAKKGEPVQTLETFFDQLSDRARNNLYYWGFWIPYTQPSMIQPFSMNPVNKVLVESLTSSTTSSSTTSSSTSSSTTSSTTSSTAFLTSDSGDSSTVSAIKTSSIPSSTLYHLSQSMVSDSNSESNTTSNTKSNHWSSLSKLWSQLHFYGVYLNMLKMETYVAYYLDLVFGIQWALFQPIFHGWYTHWFLNNPGSSSQVPVHDAMILSLPNGYTTDAEYFVPISQSKDAYLAVTQALEAKQFNMNLFMIIRVLAPSYHMLAPCQIDHSRIVNLESGLSPNHSIKHSDHSDQACVAFCFYLLWQVDTNLDFLQTIENALEPFSYRPHLGKQHLQKGKNLTDRYPQWSIVEQAYQFLNPRAQFGSTGIRQLFFS